MRPISTEESVRALFCSLIKIAVEDYRYCVDRKYIQNGEIIPGSTGGRYLLGLNLRASDLPAIISFLWGGGLHKVIDMSSLAIRPSRILARLEPENWRAILKSKCPTCDTDD